jgi:hypothetical protein
MEFDDEKWRAHTFWSSYVKMEKRKFHVPVENEVMTNQFGNRNTWSRAFGLEYIYGLCTERLFKLHYRVEPILVFRRIMYWFRRSRFRVREVDDTDPSTFHIIYIHKAKIMAMLLLVCNIIGLIVTMFYFTGYLVALRTDIDAVSFQNASRVYTTEWLFCNLLCLISLFPFLLYSRKNRAHNEIGRAERMLLEGWKTVGYIVISIRLLRIVTTVSRNLIDGESCYGLQDLYPSKEFGFQFIFYQISQDCIQAFLLCTLPFTWPWPLMLSCSVLLEGLLRPLTCSHLLVVSEHLKEILTIGYIIFAIVFYIPNISVVSLNFERSIRASNSLVQDQTQIAQDTKKVVDLLCTDVKVLLRQGSRVMEDLSAQLPPSLGIDAVNGHMQIARESVLTEVEHLLFLAKLGEGRFEFSRDARVDIAETIVSAIVELRKKIQHMHSDIRVDLLCKKKDFVSTDARCLRVLIFFGLLALYYFRQQRINMLSEENRSSWTGKPTSILHLLLTFELDESVTSTRNEQDEVEVQLCMKLQFTREMMVEMFGNEADDMINDAHLDPLNKAGDYHQYEYGESHEQMDDNADTGDKKRSANSGKYKEPFQSVCVVCKTLAKACKGDFKVHGDHVAIKFPVVKTVEDPLLALAHSQPTGPGSLGMGSSRVESLEAMMREHVCVYVTDPNLEGLLTDVLVKVPGGLQMAWHRVLNPVDLKVRSIVIVQSLQAYEEVRANQFSGKVVLFTERLSYLDKAERSRFHFVLSLPSRDEDIEQFKQFVRVQITIMERNQRNVKQDSNVTEMHFSSSKSDHSSIGSSNDKSSWFIVELFWIIFIFFSIRLKKVLNFIPSLDDKVDDYAQWRFTNPVGDLYHHSTNIEYYGLTTILSHCIFVSYGLYITVHSLGSIVAGYVLLQRRSIHSCLRRYMKFTIFWYIHGACVFATVLFGFLMLWLNRYGNSNSSSAYQSDSFQSFVESHGGGRFGLAFNGVQKIFYVISYSLTVVYFNICMPYSQAITCACLGFARCYYHLLHDFRPFMEESYTVLLVIQLTMISFSLLAMMVRLESVLRREFLKVHGLTMDRIYLESCLTLVRHIDPSLQRLLSLQQDVLDVLLETSVSRQVVLYEPLIECIRALQDNLAMGKQLGLDMAIIDESGFFGAYKTDVLDRMHACLLQQIVTTVGAQLASECAAHSIQVHVRVAPEVLVVRVDTQVVSSIVSKLCRRAIKRIQDATTRSRRVRNSELTANRQSNEERPDDWIRHHILIHIEPQAAPPRKIYRFTDVRRLRILVLDSAYFEGDRYSNDLLTNLQLQQERKLREILKWRNRSLSPDSSSTAPSTLNHYNSNQNLQIRLQSTTKGNSWTEMQRRDAQGVAGSGLILKGIFGGKNGVEKKKKKKQKSLTDDEHDENVEYQGPWRGEGLQLEIKQTFSLPVADKHLVYFKFEEEDRQYFAQQEILQHHQSQQHSHRLKTNSSGYRSRCLCEEGVVHHGQYKSFQQAVAPYLVCADAEVYRKHLKRSVLNRIWRIVSYPTCFFPHYLKYLGSHGSPNLPVASSSSSVTPGSHSGHSHNHGHGHGHSHSHSHSHNHSHAHSHGHNHNSSHNHSSSGSSSSQRTSTGAQSNVAIFVTSHGQLRRYTRQLNRYFTSPAQKNSSSSTVVPPTGRCRWHELTASVIQSFSMPDVSLYTGEEIILIEYAPSSPHPIGGGGGSDNSSNLSSPPGSTPYGASMNNGNGTANAHGMKPTLTWKAVRNDSDYDLIRSLIHHLRLNNYIGVIAVIGPPLHGAPLLGSEDMFPMGHAMTGFSDIRLRSLASARGNNPSSLPISSLQQQSLSKTTNDSNTGDAEPLATTPPYVLSRDAAFADAYIPLPLTSEKMNFILKLKERRLVELLFA